VTGVVVAVVIAVVVAGLVLTAVLLAAPTRAARAMVGEGHRSAAGQGRHGKKGHDHPQDLSHVDAPSSLASTR
jgi:hypothetical protein